MQHVHGQTRASAICRKKIFSPGSRRCRQGRRRARECESCPRRYLDAGDLPSSLCPMRADSGLRAGPRHASYAMRRLRRAARSANSLTVRQCVHRPMRWQTHWNRPEHRRFEHLHEVEFALGAVEIATKLSSASASRSRNGWYRSMPSPRSTAMRRRSCGVLVKLIRSFSNTSIASKRAVAMASSLSARVPLIHTVAMHLRMKLVPAASLNALQRLGAAPACYFLGLSLTSAPMASAYPCTPNPTMMPRAAGEMYE